MRRRWQAAGLWSLMGSGACTGRAIGRERARLHERCTVVDRECTYLKVAPSRSCFRPGHPSLTTVKARAPSFSDQP